VKRWFFTLLAQDVTEENFAVNMARFRTGGGPRG